MDNSKLTNTIIEYIFDNLGITAEQKVMLLSDVFFTDHSIAYEGKQEADQTKVWACEASVNNAKITMACTVFHTDQDEGEYALVVDIQDCPIYGCYLAFDNDTYDNGLIAFAMRDNKSKSSEKVWLESSNYIQATFLAGIEQLKDLVVPFDKCKNSMDIFQSLVSFVKYCDQLQDD